MPRLLRHQLPAGAAIIICALCAALHAAPPKPPEGFRWKLNPAFSDEFNGNSLDAEKWHDHHPRWRGRPPAKFIPEAVSVKDGMLQIRNRMLPKPDGPFTIGGGAVVSKSEQAFYGYYECRMKASSISMSSTFWMSNRGKKTPDGRIAQELDIQETVGAPKRSRNRNLGMFSNVHVWHNGNSDAKGNRTDVSPPTNEAFHTYAAWWVDANTIHFYWNDKHVGTVNPVTTFSKTPFDEPMHINMVTETYDWETPPTPEEVNNPEINTTFYDWIRAYTLVPAGRDRSPSGPADGAPHSRNTPGQALRAISPPITHQPRRTPWKGVPASCGRDRSPNGCPVS